MYLPLIVIVYNIKYSSINCDVATGGVAPVQAKIKINDIFQYMIMKYIIFFTNFQVKTLETRTNII